MSAPTLVTGITFTKKPPALAFAGNPVRFDVLGTNSKDSTPGTKIDFSMKINGVDTATGHKMEFTFEYDTLEFLTMTTPDDSGFQIHAATGGMGYSAWAAIIYADLMTNYYLASLFDIVLMGDTGSYRLITFTAKEPGTKNNFTFTNVNITGISEDDYTDGTDEVVYEDYVIIGKVFDEDGVLLCEDILPGIPGEWPVVSQPAYLINRAVFDFSEVLESYLEARYNDPRFSWPQDPALLIIGHSDYLLKYIACFAEKFDGYVRKLFYDSQYRYVIGGGLSRESLAALNTQDTDYFAQTDISLCFLTWAPLVKVTGENTPEVLWWIALPGAGPGECKLAVEVNFSNGDTQRFTRSLTAYTAASVLEVLAGYQALALAELAPTKVVSSWKVWLEDDAGTIISESRRFELDPFFNDHSRDFLFRNSFGCYDAFRFSGKGTRDMLYERVMGDVVVEDEVTYKNPPMRAFDLKESQAMKSNTGFISADTKNYLRELLLSREVYEVVDGLLYPVMITSSKLQAFFDDGVTLYSLDVEYQRAYTDRFFSLEYASAGSPGGGGGGGAIALTADTTEVTADSIDITADQITY